MDLLIEKGNSTEKNKATKPEQSEEIKVGEKDE